LSFFSVIFLCFFEALADLMLVFRYQVDY